MTKRENAMDNENTEQIDKIKVEEDIIRAVGVVGGPEPSTEDSDAEEDIAGGEEYEEEYIRLVTKDGVDYLLGAPLPPSKGFIIGEDGAALVWNPNSLRMESYVPEDVRIKKMSLMHLNGSEDVFRIFCLAVDDSEYKKEGYSVIRTIPFSEISSWDTLVEESMLIGEQDMDTES